MSWNKSRRENPEGLSSMEKGKYPQRSSSISSTQSSIDLPPKAYAKHPKATPPPYYTSAKLTSATTSPTPKLDWSTDLYGTKSRRPPSFCRRHWFVLTVVLVVITTCALAIAGVMLQKQKHNQVVFVPSQMTQPAQGDNLDTFSLTSFTNSLEQDARTITG